MRKCRRALRATLMRLTQSVLAMTLRFHLLYKLLALDLFIQRYHTVNQCFGARGGAR